MQTLARLAVPATPTEVRLLAKMFDDRGDGTLSLQWVLPMPCLEQAAERVNGAGTVNYHSFVCAVDDPSKLVDPIVGPPKPFPSVREQVAAFPCLSALDLELSLLVLLNIVTGRRLATACWTRPWLPPTLSRNSWLQ